MEFKTCACNCVFCFIDQNPEGMRDNVYVKDEDHRLSFLYGNYITLTSLGRNGMRRILEQKMTPLYVSVHATDVDVRTRMLGIRKRHDIVAILSELAAGGITIHTQIVLCPGWNDGEILLKSIRELYGLFPGVASLAIVPVGLTAHRDDLPHLDPVTPEIAAWTIDLVEQWQQTARREHDDTFVYLSDEFYLSAKRDLPPVDDYGDLSQLDNGIGLTASLREDWTLDIEDHLASGSAPTAPITILTGHSAASAFDRHMGEIFANDRLPAVEIRPVDNGHYGRSVTVAGLLTGRDVRRALDALPGGPPRDVCLPPRMFNSDDLTLDDLTLADIGSGFPHRLHVPPEEGFVDFWRGIG